MNYVESFDLFGVQAAQIPSITRSGAPTIETEAAVGCLYMDTDTGNLYKCVLVTDNAYTWDQVVGITSVEKNLILTLFRNITYKEDMSEILSQLETLWN